MPKVSIIIPIYKAEKYLRRCLDSIKNQDFEDFEVLMIDDGSPDKSGEICDEYMKFDERFKAFHQINRGVSVARQVGLDNASGEYVIHADPDDWIEPNMLEELYLKAKIEDADIVICDFYKNTNSYQTYIKQEPPRVDCKTFLYEMMFQQLHGSCWKDMFVNACLLYHDELKITYLPKAFYHYDCVSNTNSLVRKPTKRTILSQKYFIDRLYPILGAEYDEAFYRLKVQTKDSAWRLGIMTEVEFKTLFPDITDRYIRDFKKSKNITKRFVISSFSHYKIAKILYSFLLVFKKLKWFLDEKY